jgi:hypothetical protein
MDHRTRSGAQPYDHVPDQGTAQRPSTTEPNRTGQCPIDALFAAVTVDGAVDMSRNNDTAIGE